MQAKSSHRILILRALPIGADSRATRWGKIYASQHVFWGGWGSEKPEYQDSNILKHRPKVGFWHFVWGYAKFMVMGFFFSLRRLKSGDTVVCIDLETAIPGSLAARLRGARVHFDIADPFDLAKPVPFKKFFRWLEGFFANLADVVTVPHASRLSLYNKDIFNAQVVENVPALPSSAGSRSFLQGEAREPLMTFGYFGTLESHRGLEDLVALVNANVTTRFLVGGRGALEPFIRQAAESCERIEFKGEFLPEQLPKLTEKVDVYCSLYYQSKPLHKYAAPNKFFEHLALARPILISAGTPYAHDVREHSTGWVIEDGYEALEAWYQSLKFDVAAFDLAAINAQNRWDSEYKNWLQAQRVKMLEY